MSISGGLVKRWSSLAGKIFVERATAGDWFAIYVFMGLAEICCGAAERAF
jgi:hypothetical protein